MSSKPLTAHRSIVRGNMAVRRPGPMSVEGMPVIWVLSGECGHPHPFGVAHLIEQRVQVGVFDGP